MQPNYWSSTLKGRITRRRALAMTGGTAAAAALLAACGGGSSTKSIGGSSRVGVPQDTSAQAKKGGIYQSFVAGDEISLDPLATSRGAGFGGPALPGYSRILREVTKPEDPKIAELAGDLAESWELTDGGTRLTVKIRTDAKFDPRPPTDSRTVNADDVVFSLNKFFAASPYASQLSNKADPGSPVDSIQKIDNRTVVYKMTFPYAPLLLLFAHGNHLIMPTESDGKFDPRNQIRGSSSWLLSEYRPAAFFQWRRNPNYYRAKELPYLDGFDQPIVTEVAAQTAQFQARNIWDLTPPADQVPGLLAGDPKMQVFLGELGLGIADRDIAFGSRKGSPFYDVRLRRAVSMGVDRDLYAEALSAKVNLEKAGFPREIFWDSHLPASYKGSGLWLDPKGKDLGDAAKYFEHNVAEAKKLVSAAGYPNGLDVEAPFPQRSIDKREVEVLAEMLSEVGVRLKLQQVDYNSVYLPKIKVPGEVKGDYEGLSFFGQAPFRQTDPASMLYVAHHSKGTYTSSRRWDDGQDKVDAIIEKAFREFDQNKLKGLIWDAQKELASYQSGVIYSYSTSPFILTWPWVKNLGVFRTSQGKNTLPSLYDQVWIDESLKG